jgi:vacuolar-type H+-ATPase subunit E/Vma4
VGYAELGRALEEETGRQVAGILAEAERRAATLVEEARREAARAREDALAAEEQAFAGERRRAAARLGLELERALLVEARAILAALVGEAGARLAATDDAALSARLLAELLPELDGDGWTIAVPAAAVDEVRRLAGEARAVVGTGAPGALATRGGRVLDNTLAARLARAMAELEPELARLLFGGAA